MKEIKINADEFQNPFVFKTDWKNAFEDEEFVKVLGCSSKVTIRLKDGCCLVFKTLISFKVKEKKATSLPATRKEMIRRMKIEKISMIAAAGVIARILINIFLQGSKTE